jgi:hypothetical protein
MSMLNKRTLTFLQAAMRRLAPSVQTDFSPATAVRFVYPDGQSRIYPASEIEHVASSAGLLGMCRWVEDGVATPP